MAESEVTIKSTKAELFDALNNALKKAELAEQGRLNPDKEYRDKIEKKAIDSAKKAVEQNIFSKELNDKFNDLQTAIAAEESRLSELYGVGEELLRIALAIEAGKESITRIELERAEKEDAARTRLEELNTDYTQKSAEFKAEHDAHIKKVKMDRERENEEYQYNLSRTREKEEDSWADKCMAREAVLLKREALAKELLSEAEDKTEAIRTLEERVSNIPLMVQSEREAAVLSATETLQKEFEFKSTLAEKDYQGSITRLGDKVSFLEKEIASANKSVEILQTKLDKAYAEIRELATKTVESAGRVKIIGGSETKICDK